MHARELTREEIIAVSIAAAENAADLLAAAELLLEAGHAARAHALAVLALEEFGKHSMTTSGLLRAGDARFWKRYAAMFTSHVIKLRHARLAVQLFGVEDEFDREDFVQRILKWASSEHVRKMAGLYVSIGADGAVARPNEEIPREEVEALLADVRTVVEVGEYIASGMHRLSEEGFSALDELIASGRRLSGVEEARADARAITAMVERSRDSS